MRILDVPQSGSIAGVTSSRNRSGQYRRTRAIPVQPRTPAQLAIRSKLSDMSAGWRGLTSAQISSWNAFGLSFTVSNPLGQSIHLTGHQCYVKVNTVNLINGVAAVPTPPALPSFIAVTTTGINFAAGTPTAKVLGASPAVGTSFMIYASPQVSPGVSFNGKYRYMNSFTSATAGAFDILAPYNAAWGTLVVGKKVFVKVVQNQAGMQDSGTMYSTIVAT